MQTKEEYIADIVPRLVANGKSVEEATKLAIREWWADLEQEENEWEYNE